MRHGAAVSKAARHITFFLRSFKTMDFIPPPVLPYALDALEPHISKETLEHHYGKHHMAYYNKVKELLQGQQPKTLESLISETPPGLLLNQAGQLYNHGIYWNCMAPNPHKEVRKPTGLISELIDKNFGSFDNFQTKFDNMAKSAFGSGWVFLLKTGGSGADTTLKLVELHDGQCPLHEKLGQPLLGLDLWEHAYYIDYRNRRPDYIVAWWCIVNWDFVNQQLQGPAYNYQKNN